MARYFDAQSPQLGEEFRQYIFANQSAIYNRRRRASWPTSSPRHTTPRCQPSTTRGQLRAKVEADTQLGRMTGETGVTHTPTIYVVTDSPQEPFVEVKDQGKLFETIEQVKAALGPAPKTRAKK